MNAKLVAGISVLALTLGACGAKQPKSVVDNDSFTKVESSFP